MCRATALVTAVVCVLVLQAGCGATPSETPETEPPPATAATPTTTQGLDERTIPDTDGTETGEGSAGDQSTPCDVARLTAELELALGGKIPARVTVTELGDRDESS